MTNTKELLKIIEPYCDRIVYNNKHYKAYIKNTNHVITMSATSSDRNYFKQIFRDFRRIGIIIKELNK